jgi:tetratricopeptide (TPR) repeat protein
MAGELTAAIEMLAAVKPLILLLEDLHWSDQTTVEFVARLARRPDRARLLVIGTYRPAELFESGSPLLRVGRELRVHFQAHEIELSPLTEKAVGELIARERTWADLGGAASSLRQWSGNPLFLIHFLEHLETSGRIVERDGEWHLTLDGQGLIIPSSLRMLIEEHVDRLAPDYRRVLEIASAVGETFPATIVAQVLSQAVTLVEQSFEDLCKRSHLVTRRDAAQLPDGSYSAAYAFVHEFYRQVVYERLPGATVTELHRRIGTELENVYGTHVGDISSELALHFDRGQDFSKAIRHYSTTADNALARNADREAHIALSKASELVIQLPDGDDAGRLELHLRAQLGAVLERLAQNVKWLSEDTGWEIISTRGGVESPGMIDALIQLSRFHGVSGDLEAATKIGDRAVAIAQARRHALLEALAQQASVRLLAGDLLGSRLSGLEALAIADRDSVSPTNRDRTRCSIVLAWSAWYLGRYDELRSVVDRVLVAGDGETRAAIVSSMVPLLELLGDTERSLDLLRVSRGSEWRTGFSPWSADAVHGWLLARRRRVTQGVEILRAQIVELRKLAMDSWLPYSLIWLAESLQRSAHVDEALSAAEEGLGIVRKTGARCCDAELYRVRGEAMVVRQKRLAQHAAATESSVSRHSDSAEASFWAAISVARQQDARTLELRATLSLCRLLSEAGRHEEAIRTLKPLCEQFGSAGTTPDLAEARRLLSAAT